MKKYDRGDSDAAKYRATASYGSVVQILTGWPPSGSVNVDNATGWLENAQEVITT